jgi:hypothetical protein
VTAFVLADEDKPLIQIELTQKWVGMLDLTE